MKQEIISELWKLESINRHQENYQGMIPISAVIKVLDKYLDQDVSVVKEKKQ